MTMINLDFRKSTEASAKPQLRDIKCAHCAIRQWSVSMHRGANSKILVGALLFLSLPEFALCGDLYWTYVTDIPYKTPLEACEAPMRDAAHQAIGVYIEGSGRTPWVLLVDNGKTPWQYYCRDRSFFRYPYEGYPDGNLSTEIPQAYPVVIPHGGCYENERFNYDAGICESSDAPIPRKEIGAPDDSLSCGGPSKAFGNPINSATGNKFQVEPDYKDSLFEFNRYYNSASKKWSTSLDIKFVELGSVMMLQFPDGKQSMFTWDSSSSTATPESTELGVLTQNNGGWRYTGLNDNAYDFDSNGVLAGIKGRGKPYLSVSSDGNGTINVTSKVGRNYSLAINANGLIGKLTTPASVIDYHYDSLLRLSSVSKIEQSIVSSRSYFYEDGNNKYLLTGIADERGIRYASWTYDAKGRAVSSEHAGGSGRTEAKYNDDGTTTITNALGLQATYSYQVIQGVRRVMEIKGAASPNCLATDSLYTYNERGQISTRTNADGNVTSYAYQDGSGLQTYKTDGVNSATPRQIKTTWNNALLLPVQISSPNGTVIYNYDSNGNVLRRRDSAASNSGGEAPN